MINIHEIEWYDPTLYTYCRVCPECHGETMLNGNEWQCGECWQAYDDDGKRLHAVNFNGLSGVKCPECGDRRITRDAFTDQYYCKGCRTTYFGLETEPIRNQDGQITGGQVKDYGTPDHAKSCPNCGDPLRVQVFDLPNGSTAQGYTCRQCDLTYRRDENGHLVPFPECPRCGRLSLVRCGDLRQCGFCGLKTDLENQYLDPADKPKESEHASEKNAVGMFGQKAGE